MQTKTLIHQDTINEVNQRADIVEIVSDFVVLKKQGKDFSGLCPFHEEKSPSFSVSQVKGMYYCFGCNAGGGAIKFLMAVQGRGFAEVVMDLAYRYNIPVKSQDPIAQQELEQRLNLRRELLEVMGVAARFFEAKLHHPVEGRRAMEYLKGRGLSDETIRSFGLGYAGPHWDELKTYLTKKRLFPQSLLEKAGLIVKNKNEDGYRDQFRDRLMIPIRNARGEVIAFGGRSLGDGMPKYVNSPETELFDKGKTLYGLDLAQQPITKQEQAIVVEGYFDVITLHAAGVKNAIASMGTALGRNQVRQLLKLSPNIVLNFDADTAGAKAAQRAIKEVSNLAYHGDINLRVLQVPNGKDPDDFVRSQGAEAYLSLVQSAPYWIEWQLQQAIKGMDLSVPEQQKETIDQVVRVLGRITDDTSLTIWLEKAVEYLKDAGASGSHQLVGDTLMGRLIQLWQAILKVDSKLTPPYLVRQRINKAERQVVPKGEKLPLQNLQGNDILFRSETFLLKLYLHHPELRFLVKDALEEREIGITQSDHRFLWLKLMELDSQQNALNKLRDWATEYPEKASFLSWMSIVNEQDEADFQVAPQMVKAAIAQLEKLSVEKLKVYYLDLWKATPFGDEKKEEYHREFQKAKDRIGELEQEISG